MSWENLSLMCAAGAAGAAGVTDSAGGLFSFLNIHIFTGRFQSALISPYG